MATTLTRQYVADLAKPNAESADDLVILLRRYVPKTRLESAYAAVKDEKAPGYQFLRALLIEAIY